MTQIDITTDRQRIIIKDDNSARPGFRITANKDDYPNIEIDHSKFRFERQPGCEGEYEIMKIVPK